MPFLICFVYFFSLLQNDSVDSSILKGLHNIENGVPNGQEHAAYVKQSASENEISIPAYELNASNEHRQSSEENLRCAHSAIPIPISTDDTQSEAHNCNINYTNESICNSQSNGNGNVTHGNGHAIIDVVNTTHTSNDRSNVSSKSTEQLPYTTQPPQSQHKNTENTNDVDVNSSASGPEESNRKQQKLSNKIVVLLRRSKPIALVVINCVLAVLIATSLCISMGLDYTVPAIVVGLIAVVASSGLWYWLYIAAVTAPRDIRYVDCAHFFVRKFSVAKREIYIFDDPSQATDRWIKRFFSPSFCCFVRIISN